MTFPTGLAEQLRPREIPPRTFGHGGSSSLLVGRESIAPESQDLEDELGMQGVTPVDQPRGYLVFVGQARPHAYTSTPDIGARGPRLADAVGRDTLSGQVKVRKLRSAAALRRWRE